MLVERFRLDNLMDPLLKLSNTLITDLTMHATRDPICEALRRSPIQELKSLPKNIMKNLLLCEVDVNQSVYRYIVSGIALWKMSLTRGRFYLFLAWYVANEESCSEDDKKEIVQSFNYDHFSGEELVTVVGRSGLLPREEVDRMVVERFRKCGCGEANQ